MREKKKEEEERRGEGSLIGLDHALAGVTLAGHTSDGVILLFVHELVGLLLPFPGHGFGSLLAVLTDRVEEDTGGQGDGSHTSQDLGGRGVLPGSTRTVGAVGDVES